MRNFVVYIICASLATPAFAEPAKAKTPPPATGTTTTQGLDGFDIPKAPDNVKNSPALLKGWNTSRNIRNAIDTHFKGGGKADDKTFLASVDTLVANETKAAAERKKKTGTTALQGSQAIPTAPASVQDDQPAPVAKTPPPSKTQTQSAPIMRPNDNYADGKDGKDGKEQTEGGFPQACDGSPECMGTRTPSVMTKEQNEVIEQLAEPPPPRRRSVVEREEVEERSNPFDWRSGAIGLGAGLLLSSLFRKNNDNNRACYQNGGGWGPGGQGYPWWLNQGGRQLPGAYPAPGGPGGVLGMLPGPGGMVNGQIPPWSIQNGMPGYGFGYGGGYGAGGGYGYGGGFGYGAQAPIALPYPGPSIGYNNGFSNIYNTPTTVNSALYGGGGIPSIVQGR